MLCVGLLHCSGLLLGIQETPIAADDVPSACENQTTPSQRISLSVGGVGMEGMDRGRVDVLCDGVSVSRGREEKGGVLSGDLSEGGGEVDNILEKSCAEFDDLVGEYNSPDDFLSQVKYMYTLHVHIHCTYMCTMYMLNSSVNTCTCMCIYTCTITIQDIHTCTCTA